MSYAVVVIDDLLRGFLPGDPALAGPGYLGLRVAFAEWLRQNWTKNYGVAPDGDEVSGRELASLPEAGEVETMKFNSRTEEEIEEVQRQKRTLFTEGDPETIRELLVVMADLQHGTGTGEWLAPLLAGIPERVVLKKMCDVIFECEESSELFGRAMFIAGMAYGWRTALKQHQVSAVAQNNSSGL